MRYAVKIKIPMACYCVALIRTASFPFSFLVCNYRLSWPFPGPGQCQWGISELSQIRMKLCWKGIFKLSRKSSNFFIYDSLKAEYIWGVSLNSLTLMKYGSTSHNEKCNNLVCLKMYLCNFSCLLSNGQDFACTIEVPYRFKTIKTSVVQCMIKNWNGLPRKVV